MVKFSEIKKLTVAIKELDCIKELSDAEAQKVSGGKIGAAGAGLGAGLGAAAAGLGAAVGYPDLT